MNEVKHLVKEFGVTPDLARRMARQFEEKNIHLDPATMALIRAELARLDLDPKLQMAKQDPLIKATKEAYRKSATYRLDQLMEERVRWARKQTIATNKLAEVDIRIRDFLKELVAEKDGHTKTDGGAK